VDYTKLSRTDKIKLFFIRKGLKYANYIIKFIAALIYKKPNPACIKKILLFRTGSMGDNICALPAISNIRNFYCNAELHILTNAGGSNLVSLEYLLAPTHYDKIINYFAVSAKELFLQLKNEKYDLIIQLPQDQAPFLSLIRDIIFFRLAGIKQGFGWELNFINYSLQLQEKHINFENERDRLNRIIKQNGIGISDDYQFPLNIRKDDTQKIHQILGKYNIANSNNIAIVIGAKRPQNRWPLSHFKQVVEHLLLNKKHSIILIGSDEDYSNANIIADIDPKRVHNFCGLFTPIESAVMLSKCQLTISNDTGPLHLSYAVNTPVIAIFSSRDFPNKWFPPQSAVNKVFRNDSVHCSLCLSITCIDNICLKALKPKEIVDKLYY